MAKNISCLSSLDLGWELLGSNRQRSRVQTGWQDTAVWVRACGGSSLANLGLESVWAEWDTGWQVWRAAESLSPAKGTRLQRDCPQGLGPV